MIGKRILPSFFFLLIVFGCLLAQDPTDSHRIALRQLVERAHSGDAKALYDLATLHDRGYDSIPVDTLRSNALYLKAAQKGYAPARNFIGFRYYTGHGMPQDIDSALYWIRLAADEGDITAAANLGYLLSESELIPHDSVEAVKWIEQAAMAGVREAQIKLIDFKRDEWSSMPPDSVLTNGIELYTGRAPILGIQLIGIAAQHKIPKAMALMGDAYSKGWGVPYDYQKSVDYFYEAAKGGDPSAQFLIAELLEFFPDALVNKENETTPEENNAAYWYDLAAQQGVTDSEKAYQLLMSR